MERVLHSQRYVTFPVNEPDVSPRYPSSIRPKASTQTAKQHRPGTAALSVVADPAAATRSATPVAASRLRVDRRSSRSETRRVRSDDSVGSTGPGTEYETTSDVGGGGRDRAAGGVLERDFRPDVGVPLAVGGRAGHSALGAARDDAPGWKVALHGNSREGLRNLRAIPLQRRSFRALDYIVQRFRGVGEELDDV